MNETNNPAGPGNVQAAINAGRALGAKVEYPLGPDGLLVIPNGYQLASTETVIAQHLAQPRRVKANVKLAELASFIAYVMAYKTPDSKIFGAVGKSTPPRFTAIIDYHPETGKAAWCEHQASYGPDFTPEWVRWTANSGKHMSQLSFATFLEENADLITQPKGAELLEMVQTLEGHNNIRCNSYTRLSNGKTKVLYEEDVELRGATSTQNGAIEFPNELITEVQPFDGGPKYVIKNRLKYRIPNRQIELWYEAVDLHLVLRDVGTNILKAIAEKTGITPLMGGPVAS